MPGHRISNLADLLLRPIFLMTKTTHYDPNPKLRLDKMGVVDNMMTEGSSYDAFSPDAAARQHTALREATRDLGGTIILDDGVAGQYDGVYCADPSLTIMKLKFDGDKIAGVHFDTIASNFYNHGRSAEVARQIGSLGFLKRHLAENFGLKVTSHVHKSSIHGEGTGDNVYDPFRDMIISGYKPKSDKFAPDQGRSDPDFHKLVIEGRLKIPAFGFEVHNGFFHSDTVIGPLQNGDVVVCEDGISQDDFAKLKNRVNADGRQLILASHDDALRYAPNLVLLNQHDVISSQTSPQFQQALENAGYKNTQLDLSQFVEQSGGGAHCLSNMIIMRRDDKARAMELLDYTP